MRIPPERCPFLNRFEMGVALESQGKFKQASEALLTALELERTSPADSFYSIPRRI